MALQGFMDDSGSEPQSPHFVLAGFISTAENWASFADDWQSACDQSPSIPYFKMSEAMGLRASFGGWSRSDRDKRVALFSGLAAEHAVIQICAHMRYQDFNETIKALPIYNKQKELMYRHPYLLLWWTLLSKFYPQWLRMGFKEPVEFIFDRQLGFEVEATALWQSMSNMAKSNLAPEFYHLLSSSPRFEDDKTALPLQAADLHAWTIRRELSVEDVHLKIPESTLEHLNKLTPMTLHVTREYLENIRDKLKQQAGS